MIHFAIGTLKKENEKQILQQLFAILKHVHAWTKNHK